MEKINKLLVANRGEIAVRICRTAKALGVSTVTVYSNADASSAHVKAANETFRLPGSDATAYTDVDAVLKIAKDTHVDAIHPGYGFLSENASFARKVQEAGIGWVGPSGDSIDAFGIKHVARELAEKAGAPIVPGTKGLVADEEHAVRAADELGFPIMIKATSGGGGLGLATCKNESQVRASFKTTTSRGQTLFNNPGVFIEKYYPNSRHIEIQIFGNGQGKAIHFGERECSIQRRHQKVIEECPSPFVTQHPTLRDKLGNAAVSLAESVNYASAGTVEFLVDDGTGDAFFLEMNTRLQVEHGITEMCYGLDIVELMLRQTDAQLAGKRGLDEKFLASLRAEHFEPQGAAIEVRLYAENPIRGFAPSPGLLQEVKWVGLPGSRVDTWVYTGTLISSFYDPLIAKVMIHAQTRAEAIKGMHATLSNTVLNGPPNNLHYLSTILSTSSLSPDFAAGRTLTSLINKFPYAATSPPFVDVISPGAYTTVQDLPARTAVGKGIPASGPMDPVAFQLANILTGNHPHTEALELTLSGPELKFLSPAVISLCGAEMEATLNAQTMPMWTRVYVPGNGSRLKLGKTTGAGCRAYLAIFGGFRNVATYFGSKATSPLVSIGGYQGRALAPGDVLQIPGRDEFEAAERREVALPEKLRPRYGNDVSMMAMSGPHDEGYVLPEDIEMLYRTRWRVSYNANRSGIRLEGPVPRWARSDGGEGGSHPSNVVEYGYPMAGLNFTGDQCVIFPNDAPNFGGFICALVIPTADYTKLGQLRPGDSLQFRRVSQDEAVSARRLVESHVDAIQKAVKAGESLKNGLTDNSGRGWFEGLQPLDTFSVVKSSCADEWGRSVLQVLEEDQEKGRPKVIYRRGGDGCVVVQYGSDTIFDLNYRCRTTHLKHLLLSPTVTPPTTHPLITTVSCAGSLTLSFNPLLFPLQRLLSHLTHLETAPSLSTIPNRIPTRRFHLPITFSSPEQAEATQRYMETQRPYAPYLPDNLRFVAENNAFSESELKKVFLEGEGLVVVVVGFYCGNSVAVPVDPRQRMSSPKLNPSRVHTPAGTVGWGGGCMSIYPVASPGGYQMLGRTLPIYSPFNLSFPASSAHFPANPSPSPVPSPFRPWLFNPLDLISFYEVSADELAALLARFEAGLYQFRATEETFDLKAHNRMCVDVEGEVSGIRRRQREAQGVMLERDRESLERWRREREELAAKTKGSEDEGGGKSGRAEVDVQALLAEEGVDAVQAPVDGSVWKVLVKEGEELHSGADVAVLEAMKLEVAVKFGDDGGGGGGESGIEEDVYERDKEATLTKEEATKKARVDRVLVRQGDTVRAGTNIAVLRTVLA